MPSVEILKHENLKRRYNLGRSIRDRAYLATSVLPFLTGDRTPGVYEDANQYTRHPAPLFSPTPHSNTEERSARTDSCAGISGSRNCGSAGSFSTPPLLGSLNLTCKPRRGIYSR